MWLSHHEFESMSNNATKTFSPTMLHGIGPGGFAMGWCVRQHLVGLKAASLVVVSASWNDMQKVENQRGNSKWPIRLACETVTKQHDLYDWLRNIKRPIQLTWKIVIGMWPMRLVSKKSYLHEKGSTADVVNASVILVLTILIWGPP